jgi:hypothetical protein
MDNDVEESLKELKGMVLTKHHIEKSASWIMNLVLPKSNEELKIFMDKAEARIKAENENGQKRRRNTISSSWPSPP